MSNNFIPLKDIVNDKHGGDFHPLIDTVGNRQIITHHTSDGYETNVDSIVDGNRIWLYRYHTVITQAAIERHQLEMLKAKPKIDHPCKCGSLNTRFNIVSKIWECPSCLSDRL